MADENSKPFYQSKTFWVQAFALVALAVPASREFIKDNLGESGAIWAVVNMLLRLFSKDKITIS